MYILLAVRGTRGRQNRVFSLWSAHFRIAEDHSSPGSANNQIGHQLSKTLISRVFTYPLTIGQLIENNLKFEGDKWAVIEVWWFMKTFMEVFKSLFKEWKVFENKTQQFNSRCRTFGEASSCEFNFSYKIYISNSKVDLR